MSGEGIEYSESEAEEVFDYLSDAIANWDASQGRGGDFAHPGLVVTAQVEWNGEIQRSRGGMRTVRLNGFTAKQMRALRDSVQSGRSGRSFTDTGWHAKLTRLSGTARGRAALESAGVSPTRRTYLGWLSETQAPNKANQARISEAYSAAQSGTRSKPTARELTKQLRDIYGVNVRFRDIQEMRFR